MVGNQVYLSILEVHEERVTDLLALPLHRRPLPVREHTEHGFFVEGLSTHDFKCDYENNVSPKLRLLHVAERALRDRKVASHRLNSRSNRSHILIRIHFHSKQTGDTRSGTSPDTYGSVAFVDLAGSERIKETGSKSGAGFINRSLYVLAEVIRSLKTNTTLKQKQVPVPFRDSQLTKLLYASLAGNCKTVMIACVSPSFRAARETIRTLAFATGVKGILTNPQLILTPQARTHPFTLCPVPSLLRFVCMHAYYQLRFGMW